MTDRDVLTESRELLAGITPGPWYVEDYARDRGYYDLTTVYSVFHNGDTPDRDLVAEVAYGNAEFIAAAPDLVARLVEEVERLMGLKPHPDHPIEIRHGWLVETGYPGDHVPGYGMLPDSDAAALMRLDGLPGWPDVAAVTAERDKALAAIERVRALAEALDAGCIQCGSATGGDTIANALRSALDGEA